MTGKYLLQSIFSINNSHDKKYKIGLKKFIETNTPYIGKIGMGKRAFRTSKEYKECKELYESYTKTWRSDIYLEEPEQNLFPKTQVKLVYELLINSKIHQDSVFIATHSPYILYAINNAMLAYYVKDSLIDEIKDEISCLDAAYNPELVSVWQIENGQLIGIDEGNVTIQDSKHLIRKNYFDETMGIIMKDFNDMINFYEY